MKIGEWWTENGKSVLLFWLLFLVAGSAFALGYIYANQVEKIPIVIEKCSEG